MSGERTGVLDRIDRQLLLIGLMSEPQVLDLLRIAERCPVHRTLSSDPVTSPALIRH